MSFNLLSNPLITLPLNEEKRARLQQALHQGAVMAYPTETAYALGGNALNAELVRTVYQLKGRSAEKAILILIDGSRGIKPYAEAPSPAALALMEAFWPGPLTLVFPAGKGLPDHLREARGTVALRWSPHPLVAELLALGETPLIGTSANLSGQPAALGAEEVRRTFGAQVPLILDGGMLSPSPPSTLVDTTTLPFRILREGSVAKEEICALLMEQFPEASPENN